jgi:Predicted ATPase (AAA+ superfamily)
MEDIVTDIKGVLDKRELPDKTFDKLWDRIFIPKEKKEKLVAQVLLEFTLRGKFDIGALPLHGVILLVGPPGTGKTTLAKALASKAASLLEGRKIQFIEVEPHAMTSSSLGKSQREIRDFLHGTIAEHAAMGPLIVLLDEVETLAADRYKMSMEANPIDVHRATDALLAGLDSLAERFPQLLFIATSNFEGALDQAFISRADLIEPIDKPSYEACEAILRDTIETLATKWPRLKDILNNSKFKAIVDDAVGLDGRQIRKAVLQAFAFDKKVAMDLNKLTIEDLHKALRAGKEE